MRRVENCPAQKEGANEGSAGAWGGKAGVSAGADKTQSDYTPPAAVEKMPTNWQDCPPRIRVPARYVY